MLTVIKNGLYRINAKCVTHPRLFHRDPSSEPGYRCNLIVDRETALGIEALGGKVFQEGDMPFWRFPVTAHNQPTFMCHKETAKEVMAMAYVGHNIDALFGVKPVSTIIRRAEIPECDKRTFRFSITHFDFNIHIENVSMDKLVERLKAKP